MKKFFALRLLVLVIILGVGNTSFTQTTGDFQTKAALGNWSDFNAWNIYNGSTWIPAISGQLPTGTSSVFIQVGHTISVDNAFAVCNNLNVNGANSSKISFSSATSVLNIKGDMNLFSSTHNCFGSWAAGAKIIFSGTAVQGITNLSVNSVFVNIEVNKASGTLMTSNNSNLRFGSFTLSSGNFTVGSQSQIQGISGASTININGGVWTQIVSTTEIFSIPVATPGPIGNLNINGGSMILATSNGTIGFMFSSINITNNGVLTLQYSTASGNTISISNSISVDATSTFNTAFPVTPLPPTVTFNGVVSYNGVVGGAPAGSQTIGAATYSYLKIDGKGTNTLGGNVSIPFNGTLEMSGIAASPILVLGGNTLTVSPTNTNLIYSSTDNQTASDNEWNNNFQNVTINNSIDVSMSGLNKTINGNLTLNTGVLNIGTNGSLILNGSLVKTSGYLNGTNTSNLSITGITGGTVLLPLSGNISLNNITVDGNRTLKMDGVNHINLSGLMVINNGATYDNGGESQIRDAGGSISISGKFITQDVQGFYGSNSAIPGILPTLNSGSTIEYGLLGGQAVQGATLPSYYNVTFSGSGTKTLVSNNNPAGTITVSDAAIFDAGNSTFGGTGTNVVMTGTSRYINGGAATKPDAQGNYNLGATTTIEFANNSGTTIRLGLSPISYANIVVSGTNVSNASSGTGILFQSGGSFTVKNGATFKLNNTSGFSGNNSSAINNTNNPVITLENGSTVEYSGNNQTITNQIPYQNLSISGTGNKTAPPGILTVQGNLTKSGTSTFIHNDGTVLFNGTGAQAFAGLTYNNLILTNNTKSTAGSSTVIDSVKINDGTTLSVSDGDTITLHSDALKTAHMGQLGTGTIQYNTSGKFLVERYIPAKKAWRFLSIPVNSTQTIKEAWQENATVMTDDPKAGYGTQITDNNSGTWVANGFDGFSQNGPSVKYYNPATDTYTGIASTLIPFDVNKQGYMTFIRGDRSANAFSSPVSNTVLRMTGKLFTGNQPDINLVSGQIIPVNNPYASALDLRNISKSTNVFYYVWDPNFATGYGLGGFQTLAWNGTDYEVVPGNTGSYGATNNYIESGQAFFASTLGADTSMKLTENAKCISSPLIVPFIPEGIAAKKLRTTLYSLNADGTATPADGILIDFSDNYSNEVNGEDAKKAFNTGANLSIKKSGALLEIERKHSITQNDTVFLNMTGLRIQQYQLQFNAENLNPGIQVFLEDNYLHTSTPLGPNGNTTVEFNIENTPESYSADRFRVVFIPPVVLPLSLTDLKAYRKNKDVVLEWTVENESNAKQYEVEKSVDGNHFLKVYTVAAINRSLSKYNWVDINSLNGYSYYRIKSIDLNGKSVFSKIVKIFVGKTNPGIFVYPNPVTNGIINLQFINTPSGTYKIKLVGKRGRVMLASQIEHEGAGVEKLYLNKFIANGIYQLEINRPDGSVTGINVSVLK
jgi:hypothetical protein